MDCAPPFLVQIIQNEWSLSLVFFVWHIKFSYTMIISTVSRRSNRCVLVYNTGFGWIRVYPMATISKVHDEQLLLLAWDDVLLVCIGENAKEMISSIRNATMLHASWKSWSHILPCQGNSNNTTGKKMALAIAWWLILLKYHCNQKEWLIKSDDTNGPSSTWWWVSCLTQQPIKF